MAVLDTATMQRLRNIRQLGQSLTAFPTAEHSRFAHSLGALYWAAKLLSYLGENYFSRQPLGDNLDLLKQADHVLAQSLKGLPTPSEPTEEIPRFEQLVRLAALVHDVTHIPYGHTLEDQAGLLPRHDEDPSRIAYVFDRLRAEVADSPHLAGTALVPVLIRLLEICESFYLVGLILKEPSYFSKPPEHWSALHARLAAPLFPYLVLAYDIVGNTICADLIDYVQRDMLNAGMPWSLDKALLAHLKILTTPGRIDGKSLAAVPSLYRFGVAVGRDKLRHDVVTAVLGLLRTRYDLTEKVYYHHSKCAADAMLEKAIRLAGIQLDWKAIIEEGLGDEGTFRLIAQSCTSVPEAVGLLQCLSTRRYFKPVYRLRRGSDWTPTTTREADEVCSTPAGRTAVEKRLAEDCRVPVGSIIVSCLPVNMQLKEAAALIEWTDGDIRQLRELATRKGYVPEVKNLTDRYRDLWSLTVYIDPARSAHIAPLLTVCVRHFDHANDPLLERYLERRYPLMERMRSAVREISLDGELSSADAVGVAAGGGAPEDERDVREVVLESMSAAIDAKRQATAATRRERRKAKSASPQLGLEPQGPRGETDRPDQ